MRDLLQQFASESAASGGLIEALGIDWTTLLLQIIAFGILVALLAKFVYPQFVKIVDERQARIDESLRAAHEAQQHAETAEAKIEKMLARASKDAHGIVATAKDEAANILTEAQQQAQLKADTVVTNAQKEIQTEIVKARQALRDETMQLVALASSTVLGKKLDSKQDAQLIERALEEASRD